MSEREREREREREKERELVCVGPQGGKQQYSCEAQAATYNYKAQRERGDRETTGYEPPRAVCVKSLRLQIAVVSVGGRIGEVLPRAARPNPATGIFLLYI